MFSEYQENLKKYLYVCSGKDVLEIGPLDGRATTVIDFFNPKSVTMVEPNPTSLKYLMINLLITKYLVKMYITILSQPKNLT